MFVAVINHKNIAQIIFYKDIKEIRDKLNFIGLGINLYHFYIYLKEGKT